MTAEEEKKAVRCVALARQADVAREDEEKTEEEEGGKERGAREKASPGRVTLNFPWKRMTPYATSEPGRAVPSQWLRLPVKELFCSSAMT